jgi:hypothetical protein
MKIRNTKIAVSLIHKITKKIGDECNGQKMEAILKWHERKKRLKIKLIPVQDYCTVFLIIRLII